MTTDPGHLPWNAFRTYLRQQGETVTSAEASALWHLARSAAGVSPVAGPDRVKQNEMLAGMTAAKNWETMTEDERVQVQDILDNGPYGDFAESFVQERLKKASEENAYAGEETKDDFYGEDDFTAKRRKTMKNIARCLKGQNQCAKTSRKKHLEKLLENTQIEPAWSMTWACRSEKINCSHLLKRRRSGVR